MKDDTGLPLRLFALSQNMGRKNHLPQIVVHIAQKLGITNQV